MDVLTTPERETAYAIWQAGVDAVDSQTIVTNAIQCDSDAITICGESLAWDHIDRIVVVGAGKAGAGMTAGCEQAFPETVLKERVTGWVNVPADCLMPTKAIHLHPARPAGVNEPMPEGVFGTQEILKRVSELGPRDLCLCLISGGGSALLPAPADGMTLEEKQQITRTLMTSGASIQELNTVRQCLSQVKGGGLARSCQAGNLHSLILSDIIGDPIDLIASGPTVLQSLNPQQAQVILNKYCGDQIPDSVTKRLSKLSTDESHLTTSVVSNHIIGSNSIALRAAKQKAEERGFMVHSLGSNNAGEAAEHGRELIHQVQELSESSGKPICLLSGGEPTVSLAETDLPRKGGRNQELVLSAALEMQESGWTEATLLSGGTDGEDGPTNAAGGFADAYFLNDLENSGLRINDFLSINNSYPLLQQTESLLITGPTHTNVMDLRVCLVR